MSSWNISADLANLVECDQTAEASEPKGTAGLSAALAYFSGSKRSTLSQLCSDGQMTADEPEEGEFELGEEGRFQKSHLRLHWRLWYR